MVTLPDQLTHSLTWDQTKEMAEHVRFSIESGVMVYFCDPRSPWQRGTGENSNGVLRQYSPKVPSSLPTHRITSMPLPDSSTAVLDKHSVG